MKFLFPDLGFLHLHRSQLRLHGTAVGGIQNPSLPHGVCYSDAHRSSCWVLYRCHSATEGEWREISVVEPAITIGNSAIVLGLP